MILVLISPRNAGLPFAQWLPEQSGRLVAVTAAGVAVGEGFAEVVTVSDYSDDDAVLDAARAAARRHPPRAILALAEIDVERAALLRERVQPARTRHRRRGGLPRQNPDEGVRTSGRHSGAGLRAGDERRRDRGLHGVPSRTGRGQAARWFRFHRRLRARYAGAGCRPRRRRIDRAVRSRGVRRRRSSPCRRVPSRPASRLRRSRPATPARAASNTGPTPPSAPAPWIPLTR